MKEENLEEPRSQIEYSR